MLPHNPARLAVAILLRAVNDSKRGDDAARQWLEAGADPWRSIAGWETWHIAELLHRSKRVQMPAPTSRVAFCVGIRARG